MTEAILPGADLTEAQASGVVEFFRCDLSNVNFQRARLAKREFAACQCETAQDFLAPTWALLF